MAELQAAALQALASYRDPYLDAGLEALKAITQLEIVATVARLKVELGYPAAGLRQAMITELRDRLLGVAGITAADVEIGWRIHAHQSSSKGNELPSVSNLIAVASGKGGVGKSTTAVNLALALQAEGATVGLLDADIYGPSQAVMLGIADGTRPEVVEQKYFLPVMAHGLQTMSMAFLANDRTPMVWRGPMASGALQQLLKQTLWRDLDYLLVDMPPGTGDIQLTLAQQAAVTGAVIVTTPQEVATLDARRGIEMFRKVNIPVLGIVENMAVHICSHCGHHEHLFGEGGGERVAREYRAHLLGSLPLDLRIREQTGGGRPTVVAEPDGELAATYRHIARAVAAQVARLPRAAAQRFPTISVQGD